MIQTNIQHMEDWCLSHGLLLNINKTKCMIVAKPRLSTSISRPLNSVAEMKILGITYDEDLSWNTHTNTICKKAGQRLYILRKMKMLVEKTDLLKIYHAIILGVVEFNNPVYVGINLKNAQKLEKIRKRCHRIICNKECKCNLLESISTRRRIQALNAFKKMMNSDHILHNLIPTLLPRSKHLAMPSCRTNRRLNSFIPCCTALYNSTSTVS